MKSAIMQQPVSIAMEANQASFQSYMCSITRLLSFIISCFLSRLVFNHSFAFSFSFCNMALRVATVAAVVGVAASTINLSFEDCGDSAIMVT